MPGAQLAPRLHRPVLGPVHRLAVVRGQEHEPDRRTGMALIQQVAHGEEVAERLRHFPALDAQHLVVHPDRREAAGGVGAPALRDLVLVMRKRQVVAAAVDVEAVAEQFARHRRAFDVPARTAPAPRAVPSRKIGARRLPQDEVHRILLERRHLDAGARDHVVDGAPREAAVFRIGAHAEQHMALGLVGMAARDQRRDHLHHLRNVVRRAGRVVRLEGAEQRHVLDEPPLGLFGDLRDLPPRLPRPGVDLVVHVGEVAHIGDAFWAVDAAQKPVQRVEHHHGPGVAEMCPVVDGRTADVHAHVVRIEGIERLLAPRLRVVEHDRGHLVLSPGCRLLGAAGKADDTEKRPAEAPRRTIRRAAAARPRCADTSPRRAARQAAALQVAARIQANSPESRRIAAPMQIQG